MNKFRILIIKICYLIQDMSGNIIKLFRKNKTINLQKVKKIIFNRKDRIGDAIITKPLIILFSKYLREELGLDTEIIIECSKYNSFVFDDNKYYNTVVYDTEIKDKQEVSSIKIIFNYFSKWIKQSKKKLIDSNHIKTTAYIDLIGDYNDILLQNNKNYWIASCNLGFYNNLCDYSLGYMFGNANKNLIESYINLLSIFFDIPKFKEYINKNIDEFYQDFNYSKDKSGILISIGTKGYRNLDVNTWKLIIECLSNYYPKKQITVIDDNNNILYKKLKSIKTFSKNVVVKENKFSLEEFKNFSKNFELLIGIDGGGFNYIRTCSNSITIYTIGNYNVWNIFTGFNNYKFHKLTDKFGYYISSVGNRKFGFIFKKSLFIPSFDNHIGTQYFDKIINPILDAIKLLYQKKI